MTDTSINDFNLKIRLTPWYQEWFAQRGLNPNQVKLNDRQREELKQLVVANTEEFRRNGMPGDMKIDPAGNLNEKGGWAGLPTGVKLAIIAGATLATAGAAGAFSAGTAPITTIGSTPLSTSVAGYGVVPSLAGSTAAGAGSMAAGAGTAAATTAASGGAFTTMANALKNPATRTVLSGVGRMVSGAGDAAAANRGTEIEAQLAHDRLTLDAEREGRSRQSDAYRKAMLGQLASSYQPSNRPVGSEGRNPQGFITPEARAAGEFLYSQGMDQLKHGDTPSITPFDRLATQPGRLERFSAYAGPALSMFDLLAEARKR